VGRLSRLRLSASGGVSAAGLTVLVTYILDWVLARGFKLKRARLALAVILAGWVAFVALRHEMLGRVIERLIAQVQPVSS